MWVSNTVPIECLWVCKPELVAYKKGKAKNLMFRYVKSVCEKEPVLVNILKALDANASVTESIV